jgi:hypothetical protein
MVWIQSVSGCKAEAAAAGAATSCFTTCAFSLWGATPLLPLPVYIVTGDSDAFDTGFSLSVVLSELHRTSRTLAGIDLGQAAAILRGRYRVSAVVSRDGLTHVKAPRPERDTFRERVERGDDMPWNIVNYPASMKHLDPEVRHKAIEIANALLADGSDEGRAIRIAIARAKQWAEHRQRVVCS